MHKPLPPKKIYIADSKAPDPKDKQFKPGKGVFAAEEIKAGEIIEVAPVLILEFSDFVDTKWNLLFEYYFWLDDFVVLALGYGSMYNHSNNPNCEYKINRENKTITFTALKAIQKDEEILVNYKGSTTKKAPLWFEK